MAAVNGGTLVIWTTTTTKGNDYRPSHLKMDHCASARIRRLHDCSTDSVGAVAGQR